MPPKPTGKNTATREYYTPNETTDTASNEDIEWPDDTTSSASKASKGKEVAEDEGERGDEGNETPSPTPSDILLNADFKDLGRLVAENRRMMSEGVGEAERKGRLKRMKAELEEGRGRGEGERGDKGKGEHKGKKREGE